MVRVGTERRRELWEPRVLDAACGGVFEGFLRGCVMSRDEPGLRGRCVPGRGNSMCEGGEAKSEVQVVGRGVGDEVQSVRATRRLRTVRPWGQVTRRSWSLGPSKFGEGLHQYQGTLGRTPYQGTTGHRTHERNQRKRAVSTKANRNSRGDS